jgi:hypothetical protein
MPVSPTASCLMLVTASAAWQSCTVVVPMHLGVCSFYQQGRLCAAEQPVTWRLWQRKKLVENSWQGWLQM